MNRVFYFSLWGFMRNGLETEKKKDEENGSRPAYSFARREYGLDVKDLFVKKWNELCGDWKVDRGISFHAT